MDTKEQNEGYIVTIRSTDGSLQPVTFRVQTQQIQTKQDKTSVFGGKRQSRKRANLKKNKSKKRCKKNRKRSHKKHHSRKSRHHHSH